MWEGEKRKALPFGGPVTALGGQCEKRCHAVEKSHTGKVKTNVETCQGEFAASKKNKEKTVNTQGPKKQRKPASEVFGTRSKVESNTVGKAIRQVKKQLKRRGVGETWGRTSSAKNKNAAGKIGVPFGNANPRRGGDHGQLAKKKKPREERAKGEP